MISRGCHSALYRCLMHNFLPEVSHGSLARVHVLCWHSGCRALGALRARGSPPSRSILSDLNSSLLVQGSQRLPPAERLLSSCRLTKPRLINVSATEIAD